MSFKRAFQKQEAGVSTLEFAIGIPLVLLFVFMIIWFSFYVNARSAFQSSVSNGLRLAITRGNKDLIGHVIGKMEGFFTDGTIESEIESLFCHKNMPDSSCDLPEAKAFYSGSLMKKLTSAHLHNLPGTYIYSVIYINLGMLKGVGRSVRYPCDPDGANGSGCLSCEFLELGQEVKLEYIAGELPLQEISIRCRFRPDALFVEPFFNLLGTHIPGLFILEEKRTI